MTLGPFVVVSPLRSVGRRTYDGGSGPRAAAAVPLLCRCGGGKMVEELGFQV
jgi:hypothetical protein